MTSTLAHYLSHFKGHWNYSIADQLVFSGTGILSTIMVARLLGAESFGAWAVILLMLLLHSDFNRALIIQPMMRYAATTGLNQYLGGPERVILAVLSAGALLIALVSVMVLKVSGVSSGSPISFTLLIFALALVRGLYDMARGVFQAYERGERLLTVDSVQAIVLLTSLFYLLTSSSEKAIPPSITTIAVIYLATTMMGFAAAWPGFYSLGNQGKPHHVISIQELINRHLDFGGWLALANVVKWLGSNLVLLASAIFLSTKDTGLLRATISIFGPIGIAYQLADNLLFVRLSSMEHEGRKTEANHLFIWGTACLAIIAALGISILSISHEFWLVPLFGASFADIAPLLPMMGLVYFSLSLVNMAQLKLRLSHETQALFKINAVIAIVTLVLCPFYFEYLGIYAFVAAVLLNNGLLLFLAIRTLRRHCREKSLPHHSSL